MFFNKLLKALMGVLWPTAKKTTIIFYLFKGMEDDSTFLCFRKKLHWIRENLPVKKLKNLKSFKLNRVSDGSLSSRYSGI